MANTKYPGGLKVKASLGWLGALSFGVCPIFAYFFSYFAKEHYNGIVPRPTHGEDNYYHRWMASNHRLMLMRENLTQHPQYERRPVDKLRLRLKKRERNANNGELF